MTVTKNGVIAKCGSDVKALKATMRMDAFARDLAELYIRLLIIMISMCMPSKQCKTNIGFVKSCLFTFIRP